MSSVTERITHLKRERGYFAAFGQEEKVKAVDKEIAALQASRRATRRKRSAPKPTVGVETATADHSSVESSSVSTPRARARKRAAKPSED